MEAERTLHQLARLNHKVGQGMRRLLAGTGLGVDQIRGARLLRVEAFGELLLRRKSLIL
jgi:hypothetical protein